MSYGQSHKDGKTKRLMIMWCGLSNTDNKVTNFENEWTNLSERMKCMHFVALSEGLRGRVRPNVAVSYYFSYYFWCYVILFLHYSFCIENLLWQLLENKSESIFLWWRRDFCWLVYYCYRLWLSKGTNRPKLNVNCYGKSILYPLIYRFKKKMVN